MCACACVCERVPVSLVSPPQGGMNIKRLKDEVSVLYSQFMYMYMPLCGH